ncbi:hypothetical protein F2Q69_00028168 [Brassica cretica]|uniref:Uncharacterized protein n=1 Tax=Brassica cretica TaxID=69181 RepID=A0A8S9RW49_BRACR|nr:hypothetical protein F2Q69_00028168 [Brassica cretica]
MKRRRWQHRRRRQHRYNQRHVLPSPPRVILCSLRWCFLRCLLHHSPPSSPPLSVLNHCNLRDEIEVGRKLNNDNDSREPLALDCLGWDSEGLYLLVGDCNSLSNARLLTPHSLLFQVTSIELVEVAGG